jgi:hypothetical protein
MIASNFNGTAIAAGDYIWFSSVAKVQGVGSSPVTLNVTNQTITFTANGTPYTLNVPDTTIVLSPSTSTASTSFGADGWSVSAPTSFSGNVFLSGLGWQAVNGLPGGIKNVTWTGDFSTNTSGIKVNWQWAAAVYTNFTSNESALQVKTVDDNHADTYQNSDHAGTPENFKPYVTGGARGGGGSNWSGSYSGTASVQPEVQSTSTDTASISGNVSYYNSVLEMTQFMEGATVTLTDANGNVVGTTTTDSNGDFSFGDLAAGTYTITVDASAFGFGTQTFTITLANGQTATDNFTF